MQIDRLIQIIFLLLSHENITARQLAEELGVSARTIYRDINILSATGIPILSQKGYRGGLSLLEGFSLDKTYFTQAEQSNIVRALQILKLIFPIGAVRKRSGTISQRWSARSSTNM